MILSVDSLVTGYGTDKVSGPLTFSIAEGECILLCGANGCGKTTLMKTISGLLKPIEGKVIQESGEAVMIPTRIPKVKGFTLEEFIHTAFYARSSWSGRISEKEKKDSLDAMEELGISRLRSRDISLLSDGEFQKGCIASAVARMKGSGGGILILDEPTAFLDVDSRAGVLDSLHSLSRNGNTAVLFSSHDIHSSAQKSDRIISLKGKMMKDSAMEGKDEVLCWAFSSLKTSV